MIIEASEITIDESSMTGETHPIKKNTIEKCVKVKEEIDREGRVLGEQDRLVLILNIKDLKFHPLLFYLELEYLKEKVYSLSVLLEIYLVLVKLELL